MLNNTVSRLLFVLLIVGLVQLSISAQTTEFTYQGSLSDSSSPASGNYDFEFALFDTLAGGTQLGNTITLRGVAVSNGVFAVKLNFGNEFPGAARFLEIRVQLSAPVSDSISPGGLTTLSPRQVILSVPYAVKSV